MLQMGDLKRASEWGTTLLISLLERTCAICLGRTTWQEESYRIPTGQMVAEGFVREDIHALVQDVK